MEEAVAQASSPCQTEDVTAEDAEFAEEAESGTANPVLHLSDLGGGIIGTTICG